LNTLSVFCARLAGGDSRLTTAFSASRRSGIVRARVGALTVDQLYELASWFPEHTKRLVLLAGMVGARRRVWFELTDDLLDLERATMEIPPRAV
jgi:hypothetical protein